jgi:phosphoglycerate dehydrogenase-like enzyme
MNVRVTMPFPDELLERMRAVDASLTVTRAAVWEASYEGVDVLYCNEPPAPEVAPGLRWVQLHLAGANALFEHPMYTDSDVPLTTTSGVHAATTAEFALTMMLALAHRVPRILEWQGKGEWPPDEQRWPLFVPAALRGKTLGIIGYGSIGREVARLAISALGMTVLACKRDPSSRADVGYVQAGTGDPDGRLPDEWFAPGDVSRMLARSDVVVMCAPLTRETQGMLGAAELAAMKTDALLINVGRGATIDEDALVSALRERRIQGAALDVFAEEPLAAGNALYGLDNVILSAHVSGFLPTYDEACTALFCENLRRFLGGRPLLNLLDRAKGY